MYEIERCKWENGKFKSCKPALGYLNEILNNPENKDFDRNKFDFTGGVDYPDENKLVMGDQVFTFCPFCGSDIRKQMQNTIIEKAGETLIARYNGVDYLCLDPEEHEALKNNLSEGETEEGIILAFPHIWKPISEIEITDEIAKLRCLVKSNEDKYLWTLWGVFQDAVFITHKGNDIPYHNHITGIRIANADDIG